MLSHHLRAEELADLAVAEPRGPAGGTGERIELRIILPSLSARGDRHHRHVLDPAGDDDVHRPDITACAANCTACCAEPH